MNLLIIFMMIICFTSEGSCSQNVSFAFSTFKSAHDLLILGDTVDDVDGSISMTYNSTTGATGPSFISRVLYNTPILMHNISDGVATSFSTSFTFSIFSNDTDLSGDGLTFVIAPNGGIPTSLSATGGAIGLFEVDMESNSSLPFVAVEYDTSPNPEYNDPDDHHVGLDVNSMTSIAYQSLPTNMSLKSTNASRRLVTWIDYDALLRQLDVYVALAPAEKSSARRILSYSNFSTWDYVLENSYIGFTASTGFLQERHSIHSWNFSTKLVSISIPSSSSSISKTAKMKIILSISIVIVLLLLMIVAVSIVVIQTKKNMSTGSFDVDLISDLRIYTYKELKRATGDFNMVLGHGSSGIVYKGTISTCEGMQDVAVKRISKSSKNAEKDFKTEISTIGKLRHRNLVHLYGWCIQKKSFLLVYKFMSNGSLDKHLHDEGPEVLSWPVRFNAVKGIASALVYLHEHGEKPVIHRDIKASNVMLDAHLNASLGDFGLARYFDHDRYCIESSMTGIAGTVGYMSPEYAMTGKVTIECDVYSFGVLALEIACGKPPFGNCSEEILLDSVWMKHEADQLMNVADSNLHGEFDENEMKCVLNVGLLCTHPDPKSRPKMAHMLQKLRNVEIPEVPMSRPVVMYVQVITENGDSHPVEGSN